MVKCPFDKFLSKIIRKERINRESEVQTSQSEDNNSQDTQKRVRYEDGTWKFF